MTPLQAWLTSTETVTREVGKMMVCQHGVSEMPSWSEGYLWRDVKTKEPYLYYQGELLHINGTDPQIGSNPLWALIHPFTHSLGIEYQEWLADLEIVQDVPQFQFQPQTSLKPFYSRAKDLRYIEIRVPWDFPLPMCDGLTFFVPGDAEIQWFAPRYYDSRLRASCRKTGFPEVLLTEFNALVDIYPESQPRPYSPPGVYC